MSAVPSSLPARRPLRRPEDVSIEDIREPEEVQAEAIALAREKLHGMVTSRLRAAILARQNSGIEDIWRDDEDQYQGVDALTVTVSRSKEFTPRPNAGHIDKKSRLYLNITQPKTDTAVSRVQELLVPHDDKPWEITATPVPDIEQAIESEDEQPITLADGSTATRSKVAIAAKEMARQRAQRAADQVEDWFVESDVYSELRHVIRDAGRIGTGCLLGPVPCEAKSRKWTVKDGVSMIEMSKRIRPGSRRIDAWDVFPDPSCGDNIHNGAFLCIRDYWPARKLREQARMPGWDRVGIAETLKSGPKRRARVDQYDRERDGDVQAGDTEVFEVFRYYGDIDPETLLAAGIVPDGAPSVPRDDDTDEAVAAEMDAALLLQLTTVPVVITIVDDRVLHVSMNPLETGEFPLDLFVWDAVDRQPWGRGVPYRLRAPQKALVAAVRKMLENAGASAGPQTFVANECIEPLDGVWEVAGQKLWRFTPNEVIDDIRKAVMVVDIPSMQDRLQAIIDYFSRIADELSMTPLLMQGIVGTQAPDTMGGQAMAVQNAATPLRTIAKRFDDRLMQPHLRRYYDWLMQDPSVPDKAKGDHQCKARGASALVLRDIAAMFYAQVIQVAGSQPAFRIDPAKAIAAWAKASKVDIKEVQYTDDEWKALQEQQANAAPPDPRIAAAQILAQSRAEDRAAKQQDGELDRQHEARIAEIEFQIQAMEFAGQTEITLEQLKGMLAAKAIDTRAKLTQQEREMQFAATTGGGRGI